MKLTTDEEKQVCLLHLENKTHAEIAKLFHVCKDTIGSILKRNNIKPRKRSIISRKYSINENIFDNINTQEKAYFLGFFYADGCHETNENRMRIGLQPRDIKILERFRDMIFNEPRPIPYRKQSKVNELVITNKHMSAALEKHGVMARKTFKITFPYWLPENLMPHFIRGFNDGDGCIGISKKTKQCKVEIVSNHRFCTQLKQVIIDQININSCIYTQASSKISKLSIHGNNNSINFLNWIYKNSTIHLERKYDKYLEASLIKKAIDERMNRKCTMCDRKHYAKGFCLKHYTRDKRSKKKISKVH